MQLFFQIIIAAYIFWCGRTAIGCQLREPWFCGLLVVESVVDFMVSKRICKLFRKTFLLFLCYVEKVRMLVLSSRIESSRSYYTTELFQRTFVEVDGRARGLCVCFI